MPIFGKKPLLKMERTNTVRHAIKVSLRSHIRNFTYICKRTFFFCCQRHLLYTLMVLHALKLLESFLWHGKISLLERGFLLIIAIVWVLQS
jgi:hypothetical protein